MIPRFPFTPFPSSWFAVAYSDELSPGEVKPISYFGEELVLYRTAAGAPHVLDAFCPHLGAHLGHGGCVDGDSIACPFHKWRFDGAGECVAIPYAQKIPPKARTRSWPALDRNGFVMVWCDLAGGAPTFDVPEIPEIGGAGWTPTERRQWRVRTHVQETHENNCDSAHLVHLHGLRDPVTSASPSTTEGHVLEVRTHASLDSARIGLPGVPLEGDIEGTHFGMGMLRQRFKILVDGVLLSLVTPVDAERVDIRFAFTLKKLETEELTATVRRMMIHDLERDVADDIRIWENKSYREQPVLCDGDGPIGVVRKWARKFYPDAPLNQFARAGNR